MACLKACNHQCNTRQNKMTLHQIIILARKHVHNGAMQSSAELCLSDALRLHEAGDWTNAKARALKSLDYSIGCFHPDYRKAQA